MGYTIIRDKHLHYGDVVYKEYCEHLSNKHLEYKFKIVKDCIYFELIASKACYINQPIRDLIDLTSDNLYHQEWITVENIDHNPFHVKLSNDIGDYIILTVVEGDFT